MITQVREDPACRGKKTYRASVVSLIDLAGSERQSKTEATGDRLKARASRSIFYMSRRKHGARILTGNVLT